jgi:prepilin-type N-terminal cleavage/methylation domain-containing protein
MEKRAEKARMRTSTAGICHNGFTLVELIVVIFIISLVLAVSFPSFTIRQDGKLKSDAGHIASILRYLNDSAIFTKETYDLNINFKDRVVRYKGPDGEKTERIDNLSGITLQSRGKVSDGEVTVFFGSAGMGESFTIHLTSVESSLEIVFNALSGRVKVSAHEGMAKTAGVYAS